MKNRKFWNLMVLLQGLLGPSRQPHRSFLPVTARPNDLQSTPTLWRCNISDLANNCAKRERSERGALVILRKLDANGRLSVCVCVGDAKSDLQHNNGVLKNIESIWRSKTALRPRAVVWKHREYIDAKKCPKLTIGNAKILESIWGLQNTTLTPTIAIRKTSRVYEVRMSQKSNVWTPSDAKTLTNLCKKASVCVTYWRSAAWRTKSARGFAHTCPAGTF